jgi:uncharacterized FlaG/YvyC family protein
MKINQVNIGKQPMNNTGTDALNKNAESNVAVKRPTLENLKVETPAKKAKLDENGKEIVDDEILKKSVEQANKSLEMYNRVIERSVHDVTHTVMYTVRDTVTNEVIQEFPPKKIQDMIAKMWELAGLFVDEKA